MSKRNSFMEAVELSILIAKVKRSIGYWKRHAENNAEHSYQVALAS